MVKKESPFSINVLKMKAALFAIKIYGKNVYNSLDNTKVDNPAKLDM